MCVRGREREREEEREFGGNYLGGLLSFGVNCPAGNWPGGGGGCNCRVSNCR